MPRADLEQRLLAGERSERGVFTAVPRRMPDRKHKAIFGEKTPAHIRWADTLMAWYPDARIVHMVRDPRGVYRSELRRRTASPGSQPYRWLVRVPPLMRAFVLRDRRGLGGRRGGPPPSLRRYPAHYLAVRFEDLVRTPDTEIDRVCAFLGVRPGAGDARAEGRLEGGPARRGRVR